LIDSQNLNLLTKKGDILIDLNKHDEALKIFEFLISKYPNVYFSYLRKGFLF
jgi:TolA-binding protein